MHTHPPKIPTIPTNAGISSFFTLLVPLFVEIAEIVEIFPDLATQPPPALLSCLSFFHLVMPDGREFVIRLKRLGERFHTGASAVNADTDTFSRIFASLLEPYASCDGNSMATCVNGVIKLCRRHDNSMSDALVDHIAQKCKDLFGRRILCGEGPPVVEIPSPAGCRLWQTSRARELCTDWNNFGVRHCFDLNSMDTPTTADGWSYFFETKLWVRNTLASGRLRVIGKTKEQLETISGEHQGLIDAFWEAMRIFEAAGGRSIEQDQGPERDVAMEALNALVMP